MQMYKIKLRNANSIVKILNDGQKIKKQQLRGKEI